MSSEFTEVGGYIELDTYRLPMLYEDGIKLNCGRNALAYLLEARGIRRIQMPRFMCDSCNGVLSAHGTTVRYYSVGMDLRPEFLAPEADEWLYLVNYYGQISNEEIIRLKADYPRLIVDNAQAYFQPPVPGIDTLYTCRKFFGVADGAVLYTDCRLERPLPVDESFERMHFLLGRFERTASEFYSEYAANNDFFADEPIKHMSRLTENLLHGIDYEHVKNVRTQNFAFLQQRLGELNRLELTIPDGAFMYPLYLEHGAEIRKMLQSEKYYIPTLWPDVFTLCPPESIEYDMAKNILPLPVDQRYSLDIMEKMTDRICSILTIF